MPNSGLRLIDVIVMANSLNRRLTMVLKIEPKPEKPE
jgi:hypothetical protein